MDHIHGHCVCGAIEIVIKEYGNFVYTCHCDTCRRMNSGPVLSVDPGPKENVAFARGEEKISRIIRRYYSKRFIQFGTVLRHEA
jgi:hypothetical protein